MELYERWFLSLHVLFVSAHQFRNYESGPTQVKQHPEHSILPKAILNTETVCFHFEMRIVYVCCCWREKCIHSAE